MQLADGRQLQIVYRGVWSNSDGPDFHSAMITIDNRLVQGAVEIHMRASDWYRHRHHENSVYNSVVLHVVYENDLTDSVGSPDGQNIPTLEIAKYLDGEGFQDVRTGNRVMAVLGSQTCLPTLGRTQPDLVRDVLRQQGWSRLVEKQLQFSQELHHATAPEVLYQGVLEALGYSNNRRPMRELARRLPLQLLEDYSNRRGFQTALPLLLGTGGFLDKTDRIDHLIADIARTSVLQRDWERFRNAYDIQPLSAEGWTLNRVRPSNHPVRRIASFASLIDAARDEGLYGHVVALDLDCGRSWDAWLAKAEPSIGRARRNQIIVNILAPFLAAVAEIDMNNQLAEDVADLWECLPGAINDRIARSTRVQILGRTRFPIRTALEEQGLHDIYRSGCSQLRCFECPVARLAVEHEPWDAYARNASNSEDGV